MMDLSIGQLEALAAAVSEGTFEGAANSLHLTPSAVSQRIKALETSIGRVLVVRSKPIEPTESGEAVLRAARQILTLTNELVTDLDDESHAAVSIPLAANADSLSTWLVPALARVDPGIVFDIQRADESVTAELLSRGSVMGAVTSSRTPVPGCSIEPLGRMRFRPMASRAFARRWFPDGATGAALAMAPVLSFDRDDDLENAYLRRRTRRRLDPPRHYVPGTEAFLQAARLGLGWGMIPDLQLAQVATAAHLAARGQPITYGDLTEFDEAGTVDVKIYWQQWRLHSMALDRVAEAVRTGAKKALI